MCKLTLIGNCLPVCSGTFNLRSSNQQCANIIYLSICVLPHAKASLSVSKESRRKKKELILRGIGFGGSSPHMQMVPSVSARA